MRGQIYFIRGNIRIQIITDEKIYFFIIDKETLMPKLENVMYNFMQCSQMMFGPKVRYSITYKMNEPGFTIYTRKHFHNFKVPINSKNYEGVLGENLGRNDEYVLAEQDKICIYDNIDFKHQYDFNVPNKHGDHI